MARVGEDEQRRIVGQIVDVLPGACGLVLLGNTAGLHHRVPGITTTKDVDVSVVLLDSDNRVAPREQIDEILDELGVEPTVYPRDRSWVQAQLEVDGVDRQVDFIRGRKRDRPSGTFIHRDLLNRITAAAEQDEHVLVPSLTDLVLMKAWAATDQQRLANEATGDDHETALGRKRAYQDDTRRYTETALDRGVLDLARIRGLLDAMRDHRRPEVREVLERAGTIEPRV